MSVYYPSLVVNLRIRFDEAFHITNQADPKSTRTEAKAGAVPAQNGPRGLFLEQPISADTVGGASGRGTSGTAAAAGGALGGIVGGGDDGLSKIVGRIPKTAQIELPGYRTAGTFDMTFDYRDIPIDPRLIRSCSVEVHLGTVDPADFATGMTTVGADGKRKSVLSATDNSADTLLLVGVVDHWHVTHGERGSELKINGRDQRALMINAPVDPTAFSDIDLSKDIREVIEQIIQKNPASGRIAVKTNIDDWPGKKLPSPGVEDDLTRVNKGANGKGKPQSKPAGHVDSLTYWDLITRYCQLVGAVPYFIGTTLLIRPARSIFDQQKAGIDAGPPTPFAGGRQRKSPGDNPAEFSVRRMIYGRDISEMTFERAYTGRRAVIIEVISIDTSASDRKQRLIQVRYDPTEPKTPQTTAAGKQKKDKYIASLSHGTRGNKKNATGVGPSGLATNEILRISIPGVNNKDRLLEIAKNIYEEIGRGEMGGSVTTKSLASFFVPDDKTDDLAGNKDPDLVRIRPGDGVELSLDTRELSNVNPLVSAYVDTVRTPFDDAVSELKQRLSAGTGGAGSDNENLARAIVASTRGGALELTKFFRVANVKYSWSIGNGISVAFDYQNYIEARSGITPSLGGANTTLATTSTATTLKIQQQRIGA